MDLGQNLAKLAGVNMYTKIHTLKYVRRQPRSEALSPFYEKERQRKESLGIRLMSTLVSSLLTGITR